MKHSHLVIEDFLGDFVELHIFIDKTSDSEYIIYLRGYPRFTITDF